MEAQLEEAKAALARSESSSRAALARADEATASLKAREEELQQARREHQAAESDWEAVQSLLRSERDAALRDVPLLRERLEQQEKEREDLVAGNSCFVTVLSVCNFAS